MSCHKSGTWIDDPGNFQRALGVSPPAGVRIIHSWYWRSSHFTREEIYFFQLRGSAAYAEAFARENQLELTKPTDLETFSFMQPKPRWFAPKNIDAYRVWSTGSKSPNGLVLLDRATRDVFIYAAQL